MTYGNVGLTDGDANPDRWSGCTQDRTVFARQGTVAREYRGRVVPVVLTSD